ncbi:MAG: peptidoglycan-binding protein [Rhodobacteraceae bacterium]|jgi:hypothetical protein|nr:peptidoglycan-binding protein [Paracoccaceae bacterium]
MTRTLLGPALCLVLPLLPGAATAQAPCYAFEAGETPGPGGIETVTYAADGIFTLVYRGAPFVAFDGACPLGPDGTASCAIDCDGGQVELAVVAGQLNIAFDHLRIESVNFESLIFGLAQWDADGLAVGGNFTLTPVAPEICTATQKLSQPLVLQPGDYFPAVERLEAALAQAGYFIGAADWYYTAETAEAVANFRGDMGLAPEGHADRALLRRLGVQVTYGFGGC